MLCNSVFPGEIKHLFLFPLLLLCRHVQVALEVADGGGGGVLRHRLEKAEVATRRLLVATWMVKVIVLRAQEGERRPERELPSSERTQVSS